ncbi:MAG: hypothetical protein IR164_04650 [Devosia sp.]|jgi:hypothetical protein|uniref:hypothetical protein n=1 Tax=unclassified Devosia TaxID=196773 RepID=UPI0019E221D9|nr:MULTISPECIES: hypothetical protein [unclassified Devosia]MBF0678213.1 hypothetical protein [Devosia sp.]WEJ31470.1 hypothetical protein NYQ88_11135 [Devosia sp. SD17-2]
MTRPAPIPVSVVGISPAPGSLADDVAVVQLPASTGHNHADGENCVACAGQTDVRTQLFNLLEMHKLGFLPVFSKVVVDASLVTDIERVRAALAGKLPATALRDHEVARRFVLVEG